LNFLYFQLSKAEKRAKRRQEKFAERYGQDGKRKAPPQSVGGRGKKRAVQFDETSITPIRLSTGKDITRTIKNDNVKDHFVPAPNCPRSFAEYQGRAVPSASQLLLQSRSSNCHNAGRDWNNLATNRTRNRYDHSQLPSHLLQCSSGTYGGFNPSSSQDTLFKITDSQYQYGRSREHYHSNQGGGRNRRY
jgi:hypothetical protein